MPKRHSGDAISSCLNSDSKIVPDTFIWPIYHVERWHLGTSWPHVSQERTKDHLNKPTSWPQFISILVGWIRPRLCFWLTCGHGMTCLWLSSCKHEWPSLHVVCRPDEHVWFGPDPEPQQCLLIGIKQQSWCWWFTMKFGISHMMSHMNCHDFDQQTSHLAPSGKNASNTFFLNRIPSKNMAFLSASAALCTQD